MARSSAARSITNRADARSRRPAAAKKAAKPRAKTTKTTQTKVAKPARKSLKPAQLRNEGNTPRHYQSNPFCTSVPRYRQ